MAYALATRLLRAVKASGLPYREVSGWKSRGHGKMGAIRAVVTHHTAGPLHGIEPSLNVVTHGRPDLAGPLAQLFLARDGTVVLVAAGIAYHAGKVTKRAYQNSHSIGIEAENTGLANDPWPSKQKTAYARLCKALVAEFGLSVSDVCGHKEVCAPAGRKSDPSFSMPAFRKQIAGATSAPAHTTDETGKKGVLGMNRTIQGSHRKRYDIKGDNTIRHIPVTEDGANYTIAPGPVSLTVNAKVDVCGLKPGEVAYLVLVELLYKQGNSVQGRELAAEKVTENGVETVTAPWHMPKEYQGRNPRLRVGVKTKAKGVYTENVVISGIRD